MVTLNGSSRPRTDTRGPDRPGVTVGYLRFTFQSTGGLGRPVSQPFSRDRLLVGFCPDTPGPEGRRDRSPCSRGRKEGHHRVPAPHDVSSDSRLSPSEGPGVG